MPAPVPPDGTAAPPTPEEAIATRWAVLGEYEDWSEIPMLVLSVVWLLLVVLEFVRGETPLFAVLGTAIWAVFLVDFVLRFVMAPARGTYLRNNALAALALALPALRIFRAARAVRLLRLGRATRGLRLMRLLTSFRRGMRTLTGTMQRRGVTYVVALTVLVVLLGGAGLYGFENGTPGVDGFESYWDAVWWTAMLLTSIGAAYAPVTSEAKLLTLLLATYGLAVFGYITAALASFFVADEAAADESQLPSSDEIEGLRRELRALRHDLEERDGP